MTLVFHINVASVLLSVHEDTFIGQYKIMT